MYRETRDRIHRALRSASGEEDAGLVEGGEHADLASTVAFCLAKKWHRPPPQIAAEIAAKVSEELKGSDIRVEVVGPYINFHFGKAYLAGAIREALSSDFGSVLHRAERVTIEHTSANPNGPLHVGHIRNSIIGDTLARAFRKAGHPLDVQYYVNDMGRQIAIVVWGTENESAGAGSDKPDHRIARLYIAANRSLEKDPAITAEIDALMQRVEAGDPGVAKRFRAAVQDCLEGIQETLTALNVSHDRFVWEGDFVRNGDVTRTLGKIRLLREAHEDDILYLDLSRCGFENRYVLRRSDGTTVYAARDLAYHTWKGRNFDRVIDVLGADHKLIGAQLTCTLQLLGERSPEIVYFEFVSLPEGSMSTRAGKFISADELIEEVSRRAFEEVTRRRPELSEEERLRIARSVAIGAIRYDIVKVSPEKSTVFDWKEALDFERQSGPYIQYAHARACSILDKAGAFTEGFTFQSEFEVKLARHIARFPAVLEETVSLLRPNILAAYTRDLADLFNAFYRDNPVLRSEGETRASRLTLVRAAQNTLSQALGVLGIDALRSM